MTISARLGTVVFAMICGQSFGTEPRLSTLVSFSGNNGAEPWGGLVQAHDGMFYGTTSFGGNYDNGTVFRIAPSGVFVTLHSFGSNGDGAIPQAGLTLGIDGWLYGTTREAPPYMGSIFKISGDGTYTNVVQFTGADGALPWNGPLLQTQDGTFYGMTAQGGITDVYPFGFGTAFQLAMDGTLRSFHAFNLPEGTTPYGGLLQGRDGNFYGVTSSGGLRLGGTVFKLNPVGTYSELISFSYTGTNGLCPFASVIQGSDGNFYGTTTQGGASFGDPNSANRCGFGTIFRMTTNGMLTTLFSFMGTNGSYPYASLTQGPDGNFYGTTLLGGANTNHLFEAYGDSGFGTVFRFETNGTLTTLVSFDRTNGAEVLGNLIFGQDGNLYGTTTRGGAYDLGTVFRLDIPFAPTVRVLAPDTGKCGVPTELKAYVSDLKGEALQVIWNINGNPMQTNEVPSGDSSAESTVSYSGYFPFGTNVIVATAANSDGQTASCSNILTIVDEESPKIVSVEAEPNLLWPPNHQMVSVNVNAAVSDNCSSTTWKIVSVRSSEAPDRAGTNKTPDWNIVDDHIVYLRAERSGSKADRIYTIEVQASDESGNLSQSRFVTVRVSKNP